MAQKDRIQEALDELEKVKAVATGPGGLAATEARILKAIVAVGEILGEIGLTLKGIYELDKQRRP